MRNYARDLRDLADALDEGADVWKVAALLSELVGKIIRLELVSKKDIGAKDKQ